MANDGIIKGVVGQGEIEKVESLNKQLLNALATITQLNSEATNFGTFSKGNDVLKKRQKLESDISASVKERNRLLKALATQEARNNQLQSSTSKQLVKQRLETQLLTKAMKDEAVLSSRLTSAYQKLAARRNQAAAAIKNEIALNGTNSKQLKLLRAEFDKLDKRYTSANRAAKDFRANVGNYKSAFGGAVGALKSFVGVFGIYSGLQVAGQIYSQIKAIDGMNKALKQVTQTAEAYGAAQSFIASVAEESGAEIVGLTNSYTKFLASAKTTNLSLDQTENIFRQVSKAAGVLGLSTDDTNGSFRALEQILSKGKVQAEEIRGQLGERLPGAFQILARSMGLTTAELSKQLELGNVLSEDVLPGFADELEKTYSLDRVERVETLAAAQNRLSNAWTSFISAVEGGEGTISRVLGGMLEILTNTIKGFEILTKSVEQLNGEFADKTKAKAYKQEITEMNQVAADLGKNIKDVARNNFFDYTQAVERAKQEVIALKKEQESIPRTIDAGRGVFVENPAYKEQNDLIEAANIKLAIRQGRLDAVNSIIRKNTEDTKKETEEITKQGKAIKESVEALKKISVIDFGTTQEELKKELAKIKEVFDNFVDTLDIKIGIDAIEAPDTSEINKALEGIVTKYEKISEASGLSADQQSKIFSELFSTFAGYYRLDLTAFNDLIERKKAIEIDYAATVTSIANAVTDTKLIKYDLEAQKNKQTLDAILNDKNVSDKKKEQAQKEYDKKEAALTKKRAEAERDAILFSIAINTAQAVVKAVAESPMTGGLPYSAIALGLGLAQAAFVRSQPLPQFFRGKDERNNYEGWGTWGEKRKEVLIDKDGNVEISPNKTTPRFFKSTDYIAPSISQFNKEVKNPDSAVSNRLAKKISQDTKERQNMFVVQPSPIDTRGMEKMMERVMSKHLSSIGINVNTSNNSQPRKRYH